MNTPVESRPRVCVLLSTYNGERFVRDQLDSVLDQEGVDVSMIIRDDGSRDDTVSLLREYSERHPQFELHVGANLGVVPSYLELLRLAAASDAYYFAFCDQDDVWLPKKLAEAVRTLESSRLVPGMYCSAVRYVDERLRELGISRTRQRVGFGNAVVENIAVGCTTVFNRPALELVLSSPPRSALMHDWWLYLTVSAFGSVHFDPQPLILYRQHEHNVVGGTSSLGRMAIDRLRRLRLRRKGVFRCSDQVQEFLRCFGERCPVQHRRLIEEMLVARSSVSRRFRLAFSGRLWRGHWLDDVILRVLVIAGLY
jgi:glycosyltransferase involved in cell wall biosynthesis